MEDEGEEGRVWWKMKVMRLTMGHGVGVSYPAHLSSPSPHVRSRNVQSAIRGHM